MDDETSVVAPARDEGRPAFASAAEIAADPTKANVWAPVQPNDEWTPPPVAGLNVVPMIEAAGIAPDVVREVLDYVQNGSTLSEGELATRDRTDSEKAVTELRGLWGKKYGDNIKSIVSMLDRMGPAGAVIRDARRADGQAILNDPAMAQRLLGAARSFGPGSGSAEEQKAEIEKLMRTNRKAYDKSPQIQARYLSLIAQDMQ